MMAVIGIVLVIFQSISICLTQYCRGQLEINVTYLWLKAYYKRMQCTGQTTSSPFCSMSRILTGEQSAMVNVNCPPHNKEISCQFLSKETGLSCQYYKQSETGELTQFCCCYRENCYQSMNRIEYEQRPLHGLTVDPITTIFFIFTSFINLLTIKLFYNDLTNVIVYIYHMHSGITSSKFRRLKFNLLQSVEDKVVSWNTCTLITTKMISTFLIQPKNKQCQINDTEFGKEKLTMNKLLGTEVMKKHFDRSERLLRQEWYRNNALMKVSYPYWRARERNQAGKQMRITLKHLFDL